MSEELLVTLDADPLSLPGCGDMIIVPWAELRQRMAELAGRSGLRLDTDAGLRLVVGVIGVGLPMDETEPEPVDAP